jgi:hypothetical protein
MLWILFACEGDPRVVDTVSMYSMPTESSG